MIGAESKPRFYELPPPRKNQVVNVFDDAWFTNKATGAVRHIPGPLTMYSKTVYSDDDSIGPWRSIKKPDTFRYLMHIAFEFPALGRISDDTAYYKMVLYKDETRIEMYKVGYDIYDEEYRTYGVGSRDMHLQMITKARAA